MISGLYSVTFRTPQGAKGSGIAIFHGSKVQGGDHSYFYDGTIVEGDRGAAEADILIRKYADGESVFGDVAEFRLKVSGVTSGERFTLSGHMVGAPDLRLTIECVKLGN